MSGIDFCPLYPKQQNHISMSAIIPKTFHRHGDPINSAFFEDYAGKIMHDRDQSGLTNLIDRIVALMIAVEPNHAQSYIAELCLMTSYHYIFSYQSDQFLTHVLRINSDQPDILIREPLTNHSNDIFKTINEQFPVGSKTPHSRYLGEIMLVKDTEAVVALQKERGIRFFSKEQNLDMDMPTDCVLTKPSPYTHNLLGYRQSTTHVGYMLGKPFVSADIDKTSRDIKAIQKDIGITPLLGFIDHLATRVYSQNREAALLEWLTLSSYYYWGSYEIKPQNSSTNVTKSVHYDNERFSPAKVFTAAKTPYFLNHLHKTPSPTEQFVRDYGPRLHHLAISVCDGITNKKSNIDFLVDTLKNQGQTFLLDVVGSPSEGIQQIFSTPSRYSSIIIEYVQRFSDFNGFFTRENVSELTRAAGTDPNLSDQ